MAGRAKMELGGCPQWAGVWRGKAVVLWGQEGVPHPPATRQLAKLSLVLATNHHMNMVSIYQTQSDFCFVIFNIKETKSVEEKA